MRGQTACVLFDEHDLASFNHAIGRNGRPVIRLNPFNVQQYGYCLVPTLQITVQAFPNIIRLASYAGADGITRQWWYPSPLGERPHGG